MRQQELITANFFSPVPFFFKLKPSIKKLFDSNKFPGVTQREPVVSACGRGEAMTLSLFFPPFCLFSFFFTLLRVFKHFHRKVFFFSLKSHTQSSINNEAEGRERWGERPFNSPAAGEQRQQKLGSPHHKKSQG